MELAALANVALQDQGVPIGLEASPEGLHGLSHREWGDATTAFAVLAETTNPAQGRLRGKTDAGLVTGGRDRFYVIAASRNRLPVPFPEQGWPLSVRAGRHRGDGAGAGLDVVDPDAGPTDRDRGLPVYGDVVASGRRALPPAPGDTGRTRP